MNKILGSHSGANTRSTVWHVTQAIPPAQAHPNESQMEVGIIGKMDSHRFIEQSPIERTHQFCVLAKSFTELNLIDLKGRLVEPLRGLGNEVIGPHRQAIRSSHIFYLGDAKLAEWLAKPAKWLASHSAGLGLGLPPKSKPKPKTSHSTQAQAIRPSQKCYSLLCMTHYWITRKSLIHYIEL
ncbi:hypothetical protein B0H17DRAFT_1145286 [Mycena rosella]|uniref:Uncharacterized protein n=1 Tax=Mycena rosella TaxID=1033263 RepID=A0AAD7CU16_MYCRO|nr:hypothetical protein B0H17DRAFT_1145286 [Mycena rosella]